MKRKISLALNILIVILTIFASVIMFTGFKFMQTTFYLESTAVGMFRFFNVDSNIFMAIVALIFAIYEIKVITGKTKEIPKILYVIKLIATCSVTVTFITVVAYLGPLVEGGIISLLANSNLFFHLIIPVISIITFTVFERTSNLKMKTALFGMLPTALYSLYYLINALLHMENGKVPPEYDWSGLFREEYGKHF